MKEKIYRFFIGSEHLEREFLKELRILILFTIGFTIAFTWRQTTFDVMESIVLFFVDIKSSATLSVVTSTTTTIFCILLVYLTSRYMIKLYD